MSVQVFQLVLRASPSVDFAPQILGYSTLFQFGEPPHAPSLSLLVFCIGLEIRGFCGLCDRYEVRVTVLRSCCVDDELGTKSSMKRLPAVLRLGT